MVRSCLCIYDGVKALLPILNSFLILNCFPAIWYRNKIKLWRGGLWVLLNWCNLILAIFLLHREDWKTAQLAPQGGCGLWKTVQVLFSLEMLIHSKKGKQPTSLSFNELIFFTLLCASDCSPLWAQLPHIKPQFQKPTAKTKQALPHCLLFSFIHYFTSIIEPTLAMPYNGFYACSKRIQTSAETAFCSALAHLSDDQS